MTASVTGGRGDGAGAGRPRTRLRLAVLIAVVLAAVGVLAASGLDRSLVFYRTPTELVAESALVGERVRVGGLVVPGSVSRQGQTVVFTLTDGTTKLPVRYTGRIGGVFREGQNALVEGVLGTDRVFRGDTVMVKHSETYRGPGGAPYTPPPIGAVDR